MYIHIFERIVIPESITRVLSMVIDGVLIDALMVDRS